ncbi:hypothetical protein JXL19_05565 [bacterium]|nr:hypothetical protein [bacterium]
MMSKRFCLLFLMVLFLVIFLVLQPYSLCFAQYTYYPTAASAYPYNQYSAYPAYQTSSYWPNAVGSYSDPYSQASLYGASTLGSIPYLASSYNPYAYQSLYSGAFNYGYNPLYTYASSAYGYNPYSAYGSTLNPYTYNSGTGTTNSGTTSSSSSSGTTYTAQAYSYYPGTYSYYPNSYTGAASPYLANPYSLPSIYNTAIYQNPYSAAYLPAQSYYQNPYASYPYGYASAINPYQPAYTGYTTSSTTQQPTYTQPLPYYQTNATTANATANATTAQATLTGNWAGTWFSTLASGTVNNGQVNLFLNQNGTEINGTVTFLLNGYTKLSTDLNGTFTSGSLILAGSLFNGSNVYSMTINGSISGTNLSGTYTIKNNSGSVIESGTYSVTHI